MTDWDARVRAARSKVDREVGEAQAIASAGQAAQQRVRHLEAQAELHEQVNALLTTVGEERQQVAQSQVEQLVTRGLQAIFGEQYSFRLVQAVRGNQAVVDFIIRTTIDHGAGGHSAWDTPVMDARGGGMAAAVGFMLRLVVLLLTPGARRVLVLDESFAHVSAEYEGALAEFMREVCDKAGVQIILVTHSDAYSDVADKRYRLDLGADGVTRYREA